MGLWKHLHRSLRKHIFALRFMRRNAELFTHLDDDWKARYQELLWR